jgi:hypothetical protein
VRIPAQLAELYLGSIELAALKMIDQSFYLMMGVVSCQILLRFLFETLTSLCREERMSSTHCVTCVDFFACFDGVY